MKCGSTSEVAEKMRQWADILHDDTVHHPRPTYAALLRESADAIDKERDIAEANRQEAQSLREECNGNRERTARAVKALRECPRECDGCPHVDDVAAILTEKE